MDPDKLLAEILEEARSSHPMEDHAGLCDKIVELHEWLSRGGYKPAAWVGKGVDLSKIPSDDLSAELQSLRDTIQATGSKIVVTSAGEVVLTNDEATGDPDQCLAFLGVFVQRSNNPVAAVRGLREQLLRAVQPKGQA